MFSSAFVYSFALLMSISLIFLFVPQILPLRTQQIPISPADELDDLELFHKAATLSSSSTGGLKSKISHLGMTNPKPKIAFLFLTNSDLVFAPLWERFFKDKQNLYNVYVHADPSVEVYFLRSLMNARFIPAKKTERGSPRLISAARRLIANAILDDPMNFYFALVSQHCIPLHSFNYIYNSLFGDSAVKALTTRLEHKSYIEILSETKKLHERYVARGKDVMLPEVPFEKFRAGSQFFVLAKRHALVVIKERKLWRKFKLPCLYGEPCYPEEHYFPTLMSMEDSKGCSHYSLTNVNWTGTVKGHPYTYRPEEISPQLIHTLRQSNFSSSYFFARKFTPDCLQPLMEIAEDVIFHD